MGAAKQASYDRGFEHAIAEGWLSVQEAIRRGNRQTYATHLSGRFGLSEKLALRVTDNRIGLTDALRATGRIPGHPEPGRGIDAPGRLQALTLALGLFTLAGLFGLHEWQRQREMGRQMESLQMAGKSETATPAEIPAQVVASRESRVSIERDELGRITRVSAGHPADVLDALCAETPFGACWATELQPTEPPSPGRRLGRVTIVHSVGDSAVLPIRRDRRSGRWIAGTGLGPIIPAREAETGSGESGSGD